MTPIVVLECASVVSLPLTQGGGRRQVFLQVFERLAFSDGPPDRRRLPYNQSVSRGYETGWPYDWT